MTVVYQWYLPSGVAFGSSIQLANYAISPGDTVECMAAVNDGFTLVTDSTSVVVENRAPIVNSASISSSDPSGLAYYDSILTCSMSLSDPDGETPVESYQWELNGTSVGSSTELDLSSISVLPGDTIQCTGTATDDAGEASSAVATLCENASPTLSLNLTPSYPT